MKIICLGAKYGHIIKIVKRIMEKDSTFELLGFIDNDKTKWGKEFYSYTVFGGSNIIPELNSKEVRFCNLITMDCKTRHNTTLEMLKHGVKLGNIIDPSVDISMTQIGKGLYIQEGVNIQANVGIGNNSSIYVGSNIAHDTQIGESSFIAVNCSIAGCITIGKGVYVGTGASILPRLKIGDWSIIGAGAVVTKDVPPHSVVVGNPAKIIKYLPENKI